MSADLPPSYSATTGGPTSAAPAFHTNVVIEAGHVRARDEQDMQFLLQNVQQISRIFNPEIEPEHDTDYWCGCHIHQYMSRKINRLNVLDLWSKAVMYPGEKTYHDCYQVSWFTNNPYATGVISPYGYNGASLYGTQRPHPRYHAMSIRQTISLNEHLNAKAQAAVNRQEPPFNIWEASQLEASMSDMSIADCASNPSRQRSKPSKLAGLKRAFSIKSSEEKEAIKYRKLMVLRTEILNEERGRWPDETTRNIAITYQAKMNMSEKISQLRSRYPLQYLHLLRAGYFEPIPVAWADLASNPLKFSIDASGGWRGITPTWRGFEDTAEERLYWVLNHRAGSTGARLKPDIISALDMARARMASAVEPPPLYFAADDVCHIQHTSKGYSNQVMPLPFRPVDGIETPSDDTMILLDVSGSMDFEPMRPNYNHYLITGYSRSTQPKNKGSSDPLIYHYINTEMKYLRRRKVNNPPLRRCNGQSRPKLARLRTNHILKLRRTHRHHKSLELRRNVEICRIWRSHTSNDRLAKSEAAPFPKTFRISHLSSNLRLASWPADPKAAIASSA